MQPSTRYGSTAVVGGLQGASSSETAKTWLKEVMGKANIDGVLDIYDKCKGREFNGMLYVKFVSPDKREVAMAAFNSDKQTLSEERSYMNKDRPIHQRVPFSFLYNLKKLLAEWEIENSRFDEATHILTVAGAPVLQAEVNGFTFKIKWLDDEWEQWKELTEDQRFLALVRTAEEKLTKASEYASKGKGKASSA